VKARPRAWFEEFVMTLWDDEDFRKTFRMTKANFMALCDILRPRLQRQSTNFKEPKTVEHQVAVCLYRLANAHCKYGTLSQLFSVGSGTACKMV
jgi:hypothetical protein